MSDGLIPLVESFGGRRILLVGDFMLDRYIFGDAERISPEAPVPVLRVIEEQERLGGAGSVALNVLALGAKVVCCGALGHDEAGARLEKYLTDAGAEHDSMIWRDVPTITKTRLVGLAEHRHRQQLMRMDREIVRALTASETATFLARIEQHVAECDVVCIEDYGKGLLTQELCSQIIAAARRRDRPVLVDPARASWSKYDGASLLTPNRAEFEHRVGQRLNDDEIVAAATKVIDVHALEALLITLGRDGAWLVQRGGAHRRFPTKPRAVYDNTGAGDAVLAMMAVALAAGGTLEQAVPLANIAGGLEVSKFGCVPIARDEVLAELRGHEAGRGKIRPLREVVAEVTARRQRGEAVVFTNGCFDLLHPGHVELLEQAKALGSLLVVGLNSDSSVRGQGKGEDRPVRNERDRARMLAALEAVDFVVLFDQQSVLPLIQEIRPDVLVKGGQYDYAGGVVGREFVEAHGGRVVLIEMVEGHGTTGELERIRAAARSSR